MQQELLYSFDDEVATKFCYDMDNQKIEVHFNGYYDLSKNVYVENPIILNISSWLQASSKLASSNIYGKLDKHLGIISMILSVEIINEDIEFTVNTIDDRYINLRFTNAHIDFMKINSTD